MFYINNKKVGETVVKMSLTQARNCVETNTDFGLSLNSKNIT